MSKFAKHSGIWLVLIFACAMLQACSDRPSEANGRQVLQSYLQQKFGAAPVTIDTFQKTNGLESQVAGVKAYQMYFSAVVSLPEGNHPECVARGNQFGGFNCMFAGIGLAFPPEERGARLSMSGTIQFQKSEKGWLYSDVSPTAVTRIANSAGRGQSAAPSSGAEGAGSAQQTSSPPKVSDQQARRNWKSAPDGTLQRVDQDHPLTPEMIADRYSFWEQISNLFHPRKHAVDQNWADVRYVVFNSQCPSPQSCKWITQVAKGPEGYADHPGSRFGQYSALRNGGQCDLQFKGRTIVHDFCGGQYGQLEVTPPSPSSRYQIFTWSKPSGGNVMVVYDLKTAKEIIRDDKSIPSGCLGSISLVSWSATEHRFLIAQPCYGVAPHGTAARMIDLRRKFVADTQEEDVSPPTELRFELQNDYTSASFVASCVNALVGLTFAGPGDAAANIACRPSTYNVAGLSPIARSDPQQINTLIAQAQAKRRVPLHLTRSGLSVGQASPPEYTWAHDAGDTDLIITGGLTQSFGSQPTQVSRCAGQNACWTLAFRKRSAVG